MNKQLLFLLLIVSAFFGATRLFQLPVVDAASEGQANGNAAAAQAPTANQSARSQEKGGIEISISAVEQRGDTTVLQLTLNNHQFDLASDAIYDNATLDGVPSQSHAFLGKPSGGGHHAEVEVVFPKTTEGSFTIAPTPDAVFTFDNLW